MHLLTDCTTFRRVPLSQPQRNRLLHSAVLDEMDQGIGAGSGNIRILVAIVDGIEERVRVGSGGGAGTQIMEHGVQAGLGDCGLVSKIKGRVEERMGAAALESAVFYEMEEGIFSGFLYVGIPVEIERRVKELAQQLLLLGIG